MSVSRDCIEVIYFTKLLHLWLHKANQKPKLSKPQAKAICKAAHSPAIGAPARKSGENHVDASWLILSTKLDYWNSTTKGKKGFKTYSLSYRYTSGICKECVEVGIFLFICSKISSSPLYTVSTDILSNTHVFSPSPSRQRAMHAVVGWCHRCAGSQLDTRSYTQASSREAGSKHHLARPSALLLHWQVGQANSPDRQNKCFLGSSTLCRSGLVQSDIDPALRHLRTAAIQRNKCHTHK